MSNLKKSVFLICFLLAKNSVEKTQMNLQNVLPSNMFILLKRFWITILNFFCNITKTNTSVAFHMIIKPWGFFQLDAKFCL